MIFQSFEKLIGKKSIQYANGDEGRKRKQLIDQGLTHLAVSYYYEHFLKVIVIGVMNCKSKILDINHIIAVD